MTRQRLLLLAPALAGGLLALGVALLGVAPTWQQLQRDQRLLDQWSEQRQTLPQLRARLARQRIQLEQAQQRRDQILALIAGSGAIDTFMAQLSREAQLSGVQLDGYEPVVEQAKASKPAADPLLLPGLQKTSLLLQARGRGPQLQDFLRRLERLALLVVQSHLMVKHEASTTLKLQLGLYAKAPQAKP